MSSVTVELPEEVQQKIDLIARERGLSSETLLKDMASEMARQYEALKLYEEMAAKGRGREAEALALLRRE